LLDSLFYNDTLLSFAEYLDEKKTQVAVHDFITGLSPDTSAWKAALEQKLPRAWVGTLLALCIELQVFELSIGDSVGYSYLTERWELSQLLFPLPSEKTEADMSLPTFPSLSTLREL
jgi:hypothetical protein